jgi:thiol-disulfide isomerase/thioredoxin
MLIGYWLGFFLTKWKWLQTNFNLVVLIIISFALAILPGDFDFTFQFFAVGMIYLIAPYIAYRLKVSQKCFLWLIPLPFLLTYSLSAWLYGSWSLFPTTVIPIFSSVLYWLNFKSRKRLKTILIGCYILFLGYGWYAGMESFRQWVLVQKSRLPQDTSVEFTFYDLDGKQINSSDLKGKIVVFDFWTTGCGVCFRQFPKYDRVYKKYAGREDIVIYAVNLPLDRDTQESILKSIDKYVNYSFPVLLAQKDSDYWNQLKIEGVPHLMILDKNGIVVHNGTTNFRKEVAYNIEDMIEKLLK